MVRCSYYCIGRGEQLVVADTQEKIDHLATWIADVGDFEGWLGAHCPAQNATCGDTPTSENWHWYSGGGEATKKLSDGDTSWRAGFGAPTSEATTEYCAHYYQTGWAAAHCTNEGAPFYPYYPICEYLAP
eukprot:TRINITY_DN93467_c0_g1_i1.p2 TRINITY_DN93467_c0_g1~~TRINITY_DN93467_c0_g1_i1.p2  ORF type:complete len:130 (-),score=13.92 TRINITY_DN93467_c0_g1_i1:271-660(-)